MKAPSKGKDLELHSKKRHPQTQLVSQDRVLTPEPRKGPLRPVSEGSVPLFVSQTQESFPVLSAPEAILLQLLSIGICVEGSQ